MSELVRLAVFLCSVVLAIAAGANRRERAGRLAANAFIIWIISLSLLAASLQKDLWPFSPYPFLAEFVEGDPLVTKVVLVGVDENGLEWPLPSEAWEPLSEFELGRLIEGHLDQWTPEETRVSGLFLLEQARDWADSTRSERILRSIQAPQPVLESERVHPGAPLRGIRVYELRWLPRARLDRNAEIERRLLFEVLE